MRAECSRGLGPRADDLDHLAVRQDDVGWHALLPRPRGAPLSQGLEQRAVRLGQVCRRVGARFGAATASPRGRGIGSGLASGRREVGDQAREVRQVMDHEEVLAHGEHLLVPHELVERAVVEPAEGGRVPQGDEFHPHRRVSA